jgi:hypothetical protein
MMDESQGINQKLQIYTRYTPRANRIFVLPTMAAWLTLSERSRWIPKFPLIPPAKGEKFKKNATSKETAQLLFVISLL